MEIFNVNQKEIDQVKKKKELKSTNPLKVKKRIRKQKDIIMKLIDNLPNQVKDKKDYLIKLKDSIDIPIGPKWPNTTNFRTFLKKHYFGTI